LPWNKSKVEQRDLDDEANEEPIEGLTSDAVEGCADARAPASSTAPTLGASATEGLPLLVSVQCLEEDPRNPRTEFPEEEIAELAHRKRHRSDGDRSRPVRRRLAELAGR
jgi:hypothetical protein